MDLCPRKTWGAPPGTLRAYANVAACIDRGPAPRPIATATFAYAQRVPGDNGAQSRGQGARFGPALGLLILYPDSLRQTAALLTEEKLFLSYRPNPRRNVYVGNAPLVAWKSFVIHQTRWGPRGTVPRGNPEVLRITNDVQATNETVPTYTCKTAVRQP